MRHVDGLPPQDVEQQLWHTSAQQTKPFPHVEPCSGHWSAVPFKHAAGLMLWNSATSAPHVFGDAVSVHDSHVVEHP